MKYHILTILLFFNTFLLLCNSVFAQTVDLYARLTEDLTTVEEIEIRKSIIEHTQEQNKKKALTETRLLLPLVAEAADKMQQAEIYFLAGKIYLDNSKMDSSQIYFTHAKDLFTLLNRPHEVGEVQLLEARKAIRQSAQGTATALAFEVLESADKRDDLPQKARALATIAENYSDTGDYTKSTKYWNDAIALQKVLNVPKDLANSYLGLAYDNLFNGDYEIGLQTINLAIDLLKKEEFPQSAFYSYYNARGNIYKYMENWPAAIADFETNLQISQNAAYLIPEIISLANLGHVYKQQAKYKKALPYTLKSIQLMEETGERRNLAENYWHAAGIYAGLQKYKEAYEFALKMANEDEENYYAAIEQIEIEQDQKYALGQKSNTIAYQNIQLKQRQKIQWLTIGIAMLLALLLIIGLWAWRNQKNSNIQLGITNQSLQQKISENEILVQEIHHRVKNNLQMIASLLSLQSSYIKDEMAKDAIQTSKQRVESVGMLHKELYSNRDITTVSMHDYLPILTNNLKHALVHGDNIDIHHEVDHINLDVDTAIPIGLIVNELVTNSLKYAFPNRRKGWIKVSLKDLNKKRYQLSVIDNGNGKIEETALKSTSFGSKLIEILAIQLNATHVQKSTEKGYFVEINWMQ